MKKNKIMAGVLAMSMMAASTASLTANAATLPEVDSNFEYELSVTKVSDTQLRLTFYTTENPGVRDLGLGMLFDATKFTCTEAKISSEFADETMETIAVNNNEGVVAFAVTVEPDEITAEVNDYQKNFSMSILLKIKSGVIDDNENYNFQSAVTSYMSQTEDVTINRIPTGVTIKDITQELEIESKQIDYTYRVGDTDFNEAIELADVAVINSLIAASSSTNTSAAVGSLNQKIEDGETSKITANGSILNWRTRFNNLLFTSDGYTFACVEVADADMNGIIERNDADLVADYYANYVADTLTDDWIVNTQLTKTITF